ncbi:hypothetical protein [Variovorax sp. dw_954]|uniref:hypothetical protein n=1 Tax=Variovorax sp. dw_954 TaxID=2720078 RepID=UPI001BD439D1|nr:hypothetical protein [Variovorax sp. dw_954]
MPGRLVPVGNLGHRTLSNQKDAAPAVERPLPGAACPGAVRDFAGPGSPIDREIADLRKLIALRKQDRQHGAHHDDVSPKKAFIPGRFGLAELWLASLDSALAKGYQDQAAGWRRALARLLAQNHIRWGALL